MKKSGHTIIILILASVIFYTGTGVTIMNYCCSNCKNSHSIFAGHNQECNQVPETNDENTNVSLCPHCKEVPTYSFSYNEDGMACTASRISVDMDSYQHRAQLSIPFVWLEDLSEISLELKREISRSSDSVTNPESPPGIIPRAYLSKISVLII